MYNRLFKNRKRVIKKMTHNEIFSQNNAFRTMKKLIPDGPKIELFLRKTIFAYIYLKNCWKYVRKYLYINNLNNKLQQNGEAPDLEF